jgi:hypothetical protein
LLITDKSSSINVDMTSLFFRKCFSWIHSLSFFLSNLFFSPKGV